MGKRPAPGTVLGVIAIVISLGGSAYAVSLSRNSVKSKHIAPKAVKSKQIAPNAVKGVDAKESSFAKVPSAAAADNATAAGQVDGHDAVCPASTFLQGGTCYDTNVRFAMSDWTFAAQACADAGGYLPSPSELLSIRAVAGIDLGTSPAGHWSDSRSEDGGVNESMTVLDNGTLESEPVAGLNPVRCAFNLVR
jgi:hypothetical protein